MSFWQWQDDARWQSCTAQAHARAEAWLSDAVALQSRLRTIAAQQPLVSVEDADIDQWLRHVLALRHNSNQLIVIGTGGATLGAQALCALAENPGRVRFLENCDPVTMTSFAKLSGQETSWCVISKSGETVETLAGALSLVAMQPDPARVRVVTSRPDNTLGKLATAQGWEILPHPDRLGGRFSIFSIVGLLPAAYAGLDIAAIANAARDSLQSSLDDPILLRHAVWLAANAAEKPMHVIMAYADRLRATTQWYKQLWAESLGKDGVGSTLITAIGSIDQHSQLQLYLDGPPDKLMTLWLPEVAQLGTPLPAFDIPGLDYLAGRRMGEVMQATAEATVQTLLNAHAPLRVVRGDLTPQSLAAWMMRQMIETLAVSMLLEVDPYSQPAVESGKELARAALRSAR